MGGCAATKKSKPKLDDLDTMDCSDYISKRFILYLDLIGDTRSLGFYLQEQIAELQTLKLQFDNHKTRHQSIQKAKEIVEFLYADKHFSQAFPILRESLRELTMHTYSDDL